MIVYLLWQPNPDKSYLFYIFAGLWGLGDAVIQTQINGMACFNGTVIPPKFEL